MAAAGISRRTSTGWIHGGMLLRPVKVSQGFPRDVFDRFDASTVTRPRFIAGKRSALTMLDECVDLPLRETQGVIEIGKTEA